MSTQDTGIQLLLSSAWCVVWAKTGTWNLKDTHVCLSSMEFWFSMTHDAFSGWNRLWKPKIREVFMGAFLWDDPKWDQWSEITRITLHQRSRWIPVQSGFTGSFDAQWSEWSRITDPDPDHLKGTHPISIKVSEPSRQSLLRLVVILCGKKNFFDRIYVEENKVRDLCLRPRLSHFQTVSIFFKLCKNSRDS